MPKKSQKKSPQKMKKVQRPKVMSGGDAHKYLSVSRQRFEFLVDAYDIPHQQTSAGKIYFLEDLKAFQFARKDKMKHGKTAQKKTKTSAAREKSASKKK